VNLIFVYNILWKLIVFHMSMGLVYESTTVYHNSFIVYLFQIVPLASGYSQDVLEI